jgi:hypothetical protein
LGHSDIHVQHKGAHAENTHFHGEAIIPDLNKWFNTKVDVIDSDIENNQLPFIDKLGIQPLYRNYLLQTLYEYSFTNAIPISKTTKTKTYKNNNNNNVEHHIFNHVSMTYGGPWTVPPEPSIIPDIEDLDDYRSRRRILTRTQSLNQNPMTQTQTQTRHNLIRNNRQLLDSKTKTAVNNNLELEDLIDERGHKSIFNDEKNGVNSDIESMDDDITIVSMQNDVNKHTFTFPSDMNSDDMNYGNNVNEWHCYLFEFANADNFIQPGFEFRVSTQFKHFDLESGFDFVRLYINSQYKYNSP